VGLVEPVDLRLGAGGGDFDGEAARKYDSLGPVQFRPSFMRCNRRFTASATRREMPVWDAPYGVLGIKKARPGTGLFARGAEKKI
jgi:hypothetical protein